MAEVIARVLRHGPLQVGSFVAELAKEIRSNPSLRRVSRDPMVTANIIRQQAVSAGLIVKGMNKGSEVVHLREETEARA